MGWAYVFEHPLVAENAPGAAVKQINIDENTKAALRNIQADIKRKGLNVRNTFKKYNAIASLDYKTFCEVMKYLCPSTTTNDLHTIFDFMDYNNDQIVTAIYFYNLISNIDFRDADNLISRHLDYLATIIHNQHININDLFEKLDYNHRNSLDFIKFTTFLTSFAPNYRKYYIIKMFRMFDEDNSGLIEKGYFLKILYSHLPKDASTGHLRAESNLKQFAAYLRYKGLTAANVMLIADKSHDYTLSMNYLVYFTNNINYHLTVEYAQYIFKLIDCKHLGKIKYVDLDVALKKAY